LFDKTRLYQRFTRLYQRFNLDFSTVESVQRFQTLLLTICVRVPALSSARFREL